MKIRIATVITTAAGAFEIEAFVPEGALSAAMPTTHALEVRAYVRQLPPEPLPETLPETDA